MKGKLLVVGLLALALVVVAGCTSKESGAKTELESHTDWIAGAWSGGNVNLVLQAGGQGTWNGESITWKEQDYKLMIEGGANAGLYNWEKKGENSIQLSSLEKGLSATLNRAG